MWTKNVQLLFHNRQLYEQRHMITCLLKAGNNSYLQWRSKLDNWGAGGIFIYSCSQTLKTIDFKINDADLHFDSAPQVH